MYERFGEFDSWEEINKAAEGFKNEGDIESLKGLAIENGIDPLDAEDYLENEIPELATIMSAAVGKLEIERADVDSIKNKVERMPYIIILDILQTMLMSDEEVALSVMKKGKRVKEIFNAMKDGASRHKSGGMGISCGTDRQLKKIIKTYYCGTKEDLEKEIESLYK